MCLICDMKDMDMPIVCVGCDKPVKLGDIWHDYKNHLYHEDCYFKQIYEEHKTHYNGIVFCYGCHIPLEEITGTIGVINHHLYCMGCSEEVEEYEF